MGDRCWILDFKLSPCSICVFFWVIPRRLSSNSRRFGTLYQFHIHRQVDEVCWIVAGMSAEQKQLIHASQNAVYKTLFAPESPLSFCSVHVGWRRGEWDCACAQNLNNCRFIPHGKLTSMCVLKVVMAFWNRSNHFDTPCIMQSACKWTEINVL